jgi:hypothetical protein
MTFAVTQYGRVLNRVRELRVVSKENNTNLEAAAGSGSSPS